MMIRPLNRGSEFPHLKANAILINDKGFIMIVDCGDRHDASSLQKELARYGFSPAQVEVVVLTHLHADHCENIDLFKNARIAIHWKEIDFLERLLRTRSNDELVSAIFEHYEHIQAYYMRFMCRQFEINRAMYRKMIKDLGQFILVDTDFPVEGNIKMIETIGHSVGHMSVLLSLDNPVWITGDAIVSLRCWNQPDRGRNQICWNRLCHAKSCSRIASHGGVVIPGHGLPFDIKSAKMLDYKELL